MRHVFSYARLFIASWLFMGGVALQFVPSAAALERDARWRERQLRKIPAEAAEACRGTTGADAEAVRAIAVAAMVTYSSAIVARAARSSGFEGLLNWM